ncbi:phosphoglycerate kinase [Verrucomicrobiaceae bacterium N1E253]|uniref:Phosphoglycerate kinase n=1 Tax=Oceaniferula marina TaxID=2748318 RepID=A0A851GP12_9BACT|nr:phosphoglycerate kinase [Oceaniferula marina]NWK56865.1 phosphoglycerate kinase [Oceaniferula marina]
MSKLSIRDLDVSGKSVLMRVDFNVPLNDAGEITDDTRIVAALPSIKHLLDGGAKLSLCSHLGRPKGEPDPKFSLRPAAVRLGELLGKEVAFADDCVAAADQRAALAEGDVILLENTRFHVGEKKNDPEFAKALTGDAEVFVNDAFGTAHRAHGSTEGVTHYVSQSAMGFLIERELEFLCEKLESPESPFLVIMGGAKVSDKIEVITALLEKADTFIIGGAMAYTFSKAQGYDVGSSLVEEDKLDLALDILRLAKEKNTRFLLPVDHCVSQEFKDGVETRNVTVEDGIEDGWMGLDIGSASIETFVAEALNAKTIVWNGPMGVFEMASYEAGTKSLALAVAKSDALSIVGGGDSVTAVKKYGLGEDVSFISTGGGASLELLEGKELPGVAALSES